MATKPQKEWRIYYGDGSTFDNTMGAPEDAPPTDVQVITRLSKDDGILALHNWDWYYYQQGVGWRGADLWGLLDKLMYVRGVGAVKQARTIEDGEFRIILNRAYTETDFPPKTTGLQINERPRVEQIPGVERLI